MSSIDQDLHYDTNLDVIGMDRPPTYYEVGNAPAPSAKTEDRNGYGYSNQPEADGKAAETPGHKTPRLFDPTVKLNFQEVYRSICKYGNTPCAWSLRKLGSHRKLGRLLRREGSIDTVPRLTKDRLYLHIRLQILGKDVAEAHQRFLKHTVNESMTYPCSHRDFMTSHGANLFGVPACSRGQFLHAARTAGGFAQRSWHKLRTLNIIWPPQISCRTCRTDGSALCYRGLSGIYVAELHVIHELGDVRERSGMDWADYFLGQDVSCSHGEPRRRFGEVSRSYVDDALLQPLRRE